MTDDGSITRSEVSALLAQLPEGSRVLRALSFEVAGATVETYAIETPTSVLIPIRARLPWGGYVTGAFETDHETYRRAVKANQDHGIVRNVRALLAGRGIALDVRPILPR